MNAARANSDETVRGRTDNAMTNKSIARKYRSWLAVPLLVVAAAGIWVAFDPGFRHGRTIWDVVADIPREAFGNSVRAYLMDHPEVILEAVRRFEERQQASAQSEDQTLVTSRADEVFRAADSPVGGNPDGDITLVEFFDYNCPYCRQVGPVMIEAEKADPKLRIVYKEFPILGPNSTFAAKAALAVQKQGKYAAFHKRLMQARTAVDERRVMEVAAAMGIDVERMKSDMNDPDIAAAIERNLALAVALRISGTPGFVVGQRILRGATDLKTLQGLISEARNPR